MDSRYQAIVVCTLLLIGCAGTQTNGDVELAKKCFASADEAYKNGDYHRAMELLDQAVRLNPNYAEAYVKRGAVRLDRAYSPQANGHNYVQEIDASIDDFTMAARIFPIYYEAYFNRALAYGAKRQYKAAAQDLVNYCLKLRPSDKEAHLWLAKVYDEGWEDKQPLVIRHIEKYLELGGTDEWARKRLDEFKAGAQKSMQEQEDEKQAAAMFDQARKLIMEGKQDEALKVLEELLKKYPHTQIAREKVIPGMIDALRGKPQEQPKKNDKK